MRKIKLLFMFFVVRWYTAAGVHTSGDFKYKVDAQHFANSKLLLPEVLKVEIEEINE